MNEARGQTDLMPNVEHPLQEVHPVGEAGGEGGDVAGVAAYCAPSLLS